MTREGEREVPGLWIADSKGVRFWLSVMRELLRRMLWSEAGDELMAAQEAAPRATGSLPGRTSRRRGRGRPDPGGLFSPRNLIQNDGTGVPFSSATGLLRDFHGETREIQQQRSPITNVRRCLSR